MGDQQSRDHSSEIQTPEEKDDMPFSLTETDNISLRTKDEDFKPHTWDGLKEIIGKNAFGLVCCRTLQGALGNQYIRHIQEYQAVLAEKKILQCWPKISLSISIV